MKATLHLVRNDLRRFRGWAFLIAGLVAMTDIIGWLLVFHPGSGAEADIQRLWSSFDIANGCIRAAELIAPFGFVLQLVQADRLMGSNAFWLTRPISGSALLISKTITGILVLVLFPVAVSLPWWLSCGFGTREIAFGAAEFAIAALAIGVPAAFVAALADSLGRAMLWGILIVPIAALLLITTASGYLGGDVRGPGLAGWAGIVAIVLTLLVVTALQYVWRRLVISVAALALGVGASVGALRPLGNALDSLSRGHEPRGRQPDGLQFEFVGATMMTDRYDIDKRSRIDARFRFTGVPQGLVLTGSQAQQVWHWPGGTDLTRVGMISGITLEMVDALRAMGYHPPPRDPETTAWWQKKTEERRAKYGDASAKTMVSTSGPTFVVRTWVPPSLGKKMQDTPCAYSATVNFQLARPYLAASSALLSSGWRAAAAHGLRIARQQTVHTTSHGVPRESLTIWVVQSDSDDLMRGVLGTTADRATAFNIAVVDETTKEGGWYSPRRVTSMTVNSVRLSYGRTELYGRAVIRNGEWQQVPLASPEHVTVARVAFTPVTEFSSQMNVDPFTTEPPNTARHALLDVIGTSVIPRR